MFAFKPRIEIASRVVLIAVMLFNALAPTAAAQAKQETAIATGHVAPSVKQENHSIPTFQRPKPRVGERPADSSQTDLDAQQSILFVENVGQFDSRIKFVVNGPDGVVLLTEDAIWLSIQDIVQDNDPTSLVSLRQ